MQLPYTKNCFVCGAHNPHGLGLRFRQVGDEVHSDFTPAAHHAGFRDIVHGGILSTALDEAMFWAAACRMKRFCLAAELYVRFIRKVAVGQKMLLVARFEIDRRRIWESSAELRDAAGNVYVADTNHDRVQKFDANGTFLTAWGKLGEDEWPVRWAWRGGRGRVGRCLRRRHLQPPYPKVQHNRRLPQRLGHGGVWQWPVLSPIWRGDGHRGKRLCRGHEQQSHPKV